MNLATALGESIRECRVSKGMTLRDLSALSNTSLGYLSEIERGTKEVSSVVLESIARGLDVPLYTIVSTASLKMAFSQPEFARPERMEKLATV